ncbi:hypothetical protein D3C76_748660 [compost metagenome]
MDNVRKKAVVKKFVSVSFPNGSSLPLYEGDEYYFDGEYIAPEVGPRPPEHMIVLHKDGHAPFAVNKRFVNIE